jgi:hypothetical protein
MTNLVYWYGAYDNPEGAFSFVPTTKLVDFDTGKKRVDKKVETLYKKSRLSSTDELLQKGILEMEEDLKLDPSERSGNIGRDFLEVYEHKIKAGQEYVPEPITPLQLPVSAPKKKPAKRKLADAEETPADDSTKNKTKKAKSGKKPGRKKKDPDAVDLKKKKKILANAEAGNYGGEGREKGGAVVAGDKVVEMGEPTKEGVSEATKRLSAHDEYMLALAEEEEVSVDSDDEDADVDGAESDDDAADEGQLHGIESSRKPKKSKSRAASDNSKKAPPKKKGKIAKAKLEKRPKGEKKVLSEEKKRKDQQRLFRKCEKGYAHLIRRWERAIGNKDADQIQRIYTELYDVVDQFTAPFIEVYELSALMKDSKKIVSSGKRKELLAKLKEQYSTKKAEVPSGFTVEKTYEEQTDKASVAPKSAKLKKVQSITSLDGEDTPAVEKSSDSQERGNASYIHRSTSKGQDLDAGPPSVASKSEQSTQPPKQQAPPPSKVDKKKKFSLGNLMRPTSTTPQQDVNDTKPPLSTSKETPVVAVAQPAKKAPTWLSQESGATRSPLDEDRLFALEFLLQAIPNVPDGKDVDHNVIARNLELAIHNWSGSQETGNSAALENDHATLGNGASRGDGARLDKYWNKVHAVVAGISGKHQVGTLAGMIAQGRFNTPEEVVKLSDSDLFKSFLGKSL